VSVNVDARELRASGYVDAVEDAIGDVFPPSALIIELTETTELEQERDAVETLNCLKELGPRLALDEFGTGCSSLVTLSRLPVDLLKIASPLVAGVGSDAGNSAGLLAGALGIGRELGLMTIAKGIEHAEQRSALVELGCELGQGYLLGSPLDSSQATALVQANVTRAPLS
jgi:EAL domain-containing protein (putative c-di-GMP-specific phosphodiesterase class I)